jgi:hypothetical protein
MTGNGTPKKTSLSLPEELAARVSASGQTYRALIERGLESLGGHVHAWSCAGCGSTLDTSSGQEEAGRAAQALAAARDRIRELEGKLSRQATGAARDEEGMAEWAEQLRGSEQTIASLRAEVRRLEELRQIGAEEGCRQKERIAALEAATGLTAEQAEALQDTEAGAIASAAAAELELRRAHTTIGELESELASARESIDAGRAGYEGLEETVRAWQTWAGQVCAALGLGTDTGKVLPAVTALQRAVQDMAGSQPSSWQADIAMRAMLASQRRPAPLSAPLGAGTEESFTGDDGEPDQVPGGPRHFGPEDISEGLATGHPGYAGALQDLTDSEDM